MIGSAGGGESSTRSATVWRVVHIRYTDRRMPRVLNLQGAAELLHVSPQYVHRLAEAGRLVGVKVGSSWFFREAVVERFRDQRQKNAPPAAE